MGSYGRTYPRMTSYILVKAMNTFSKDHTSFKLLKASGLTNHRLLRRHCHHHQQHLYFPGKLTVHVRIILVLQQPPLEEKTSHGAYLMTSVNTKPTRPKPPENLPEKQ